MPSPARAKAVERHGKEPLNTQSLRSHHNVQAPKMARELNPFLRGMYTQRRSATPPVPKADFLQAAELRCPTQIALGGETRTVGRRHRKRGDGWLFHLLGCTREHMGEANSFMLVYLLSNIGRGLPTKGRTDIFQMPRFSISSSMDRTLPQGVIGWFCCVFIRTEPSPYMCILLWGECLK
jgi:hypothetical protein